MTPEQVAKTNSEHAHQAALFLWMAYQMHKWPNLKLAYAIPNGGHRDKITAAKLKAEGVKAGTSDIMIPIARKGFYGFFLEMKKPGKRTGESDKQKEFGAGVEDEGYFYAVCEHWEEASHLIEWYMTNEPK